MAADLSSWMDDTIGVVVLCIAVFAAAAFIAVIFLCILKVKRWWRLLKLGGVTTLERTLNYGCTLCLESMEAGEKVRTLSCDHVFHCGGTGKCKDGIDKWLLNAPEMLCPLCRQSPDPVDASKRPPVSSPSTSASTSTQDLEAPLRAPANDQTLPEASSSAPAPPPPPAQSPPPTSTPDSEEALPLPVHWFDEGLPEAWSSQ